MADSGDIPGGFEHTSMDELLQRIAELSKQVIPGVAEASVSLVENDKATTAAYTGRLALDLDETQYGRGYGPCLEAAVGEEIREITDARTETRWPDYVPVCVERGSLSSLSVPVPVREGIDGALNLYGLDAGAFDDDARDTGRTFASYAAAAVHNMHLLGESTELRESVTRVEDWTVDVLIGAHRRRACLVDRRRGRIDDGAAHPRTTEDSSAGPLI
jgi:GAF domain-containing protein